MAFIPVQTGNFPNDTNADPIRVAFDIVNQNFNQLFGNLSNVASNVTAITAGTGIAVSAPIGAVTITSLFSSLNVHSDTLAITGIGGAVPPGGTINRDYSVNNATDQLIIEIDPTSNVAANNVTVSNNITVANNVTVTTGNINVTTGNLVVGGTITGNIRSANTNAVQFSDSTGNVTTDTNFAYNPANTTLTLNTGNLNTQNVVAGYSISSAVLSVATDATIYGAVAAGSVNSIGDYTGSGNLVITGNATVANITSSNITSTGTITAVYLVGDGSNISDISGSNITTGTISNTVLSGNYTINIAGNSTTSGTVTSNDQSNITSLGTLTGLTVSGMTSSNNLTVLRDTYANTANYLGALRSQSLASNTVVEGVTGLFSGAMTVGAVNSTGAATVNSLLSNTSVDGTTATFSGNITSGNLSSGNITSTANVSAVNVAASNNIDSITYTGTSLTLSGAVNSISVNTNQVAVIGDTISGNVYANSGNIRTQTLTVTGSITGVNGIYSGNVNAGNVVATALVTGQNLSAINSVTANSVIANISLSTPLVTATASQIGTINSTDVIVANTVTVSAIKFSGLSSDPPGSSGLMYYNSTTGQLRIYNGILSQWQNLN